MDVSIYNNIGELLEALRLRTALLEEKIKRKKHLEEILILRREIILLKQAQEKRVSKRHEIQICPYCHHFTTF